ncbi:nucleotide exchange factor GrpE [Alkalitalea saponilacus]|uniref:Protein GrpE n=1 Tax=Alkalitalea saponilacus TaxID=889453 RepID=A0A1T5AW25_9BACT|nr:nucleotide exchange factor GrpE [Alkalitalea saponilacus]ASB48575.1 nucleotide exchange factor GrpE [Alkalitalea saponilacus]SKB39166.1 molecular chaperone GrpE [Alkalitalea saponilacus]
MAKKSSAKKEKEDVVNETEEVEQSTKLEKEDVDSKNNGEANQSEDQEQGEVDEKEEMIEKLQQQISDLNDKHIRLIAEYDNYRKRTLKEKIDLSRQAGEKIFVDILSVVDDFERAIQHLGSASDLDSVKDGIDLIYNKFTGYLSRQGVKVIETENQEFDADLHEAVTKIPAPSEEMKGKIVDCVQKGYMLDDKVIRYPKVVVGE